MTSQTGKQTVTRQILVSGQLPSTKVALQLGLELGLELGLRLRFGAIFLAGNCFRTTYTAQRIKEQSQSDNEIWSDLHIIS